MAKRPTLTDLTSQYSAQSTVNGNNDEIEQAFDNTLSRDGSSPNQMESDFDLNGYDVLNGGTINTASIVLNGEVISPSSVSYNSTVSDYLTGATILDGIKFDDTSSLVDNSDNTKVVQFQVSGVSSATTRVWQFPDVSDVFVGESATQNLTNKTLSSPAIEGGGTDDPTISAGSGTPEGSVTAEIGSLYLRTDGGASTSLYVKESGSGNTGWVAK